jgi:hypothetical protein
MLMVVHLFSVVVGRCLMSHGRYLICRGLHRAFSRLLFFDACDRYPGLIFRDSYRVERVHNMHTSALDWNVLFLDAEDTIERIIQSKIMSGSTTTTMMMDDTSQDPFPTLTSSLLTLFSIIVDQRSQSIHNTLIRKRSWYYSLK